MHHRTKSNGKVDVWDAEEGKHVEMWPTDAKHAIGVDPKRYSLDRPAPEPEPVSDENENDESSDG